MMTIFVELQSVEYDLVTGPKHRCISPAFYHSCRRLCASCSSSPVAFRALLRELLGAQVFAFRAHNCRDVCRSHVNDYD